MCDKHVVLIHMIRFQTIGSSRVCCSLVCRRGRQNQYRKISFVVMYAYACTVVDGCHIVSYFACFLFSLFIFFTRYSVRRHFIIYFDVDTVVV
jgi:hypothetical protein